MAYVQQDDDQQQQQQGQAPKISGTDLGGSTLNAKTPQSATFQSPNQTGVGQFTDVNAYIDANQQQSQDLGTKASQNLSDVGNKAKNTADTTESQFESDVTKASPTYSQDQLNQYAADPTKVDNADTFKQAAFGNYSGPSAFDPAAATTDINEANRQFKNIGDQTGQREITRGLETNPTEGVTTLDNMLLFQNPNSVQQMQNTVSGFGNLNDYLAGKTTAANAFGTQAATNRDTTRQNIGTTFGNAMTGITDTANTNLKGKQDALTALAGNVTGGLHDYNWTPEEMKALGLDQPTINAINARNAQAIQPITYETVNTVPTQKHANAINIDPSSYFTQTVSPSDYNLANTANPNEVSRYNALAGLSGINPSYLTDADLANAKPVGDQIGTFNSSGLNSAFDTSLGSRAGQISSTLNADIVGMQAERDRLAAVAGNNNEVVKSYEAMIKGYKDDLAKYGTYTPPA